MATIVLFVYWFTTATIIYFATELLRIRQLASLKWLSHNILVFVGQIFGL